MACCTTIPPLNNKRKSGGLFDLPRSAKHRRPLSSSNLNSSSFINSNSPCKSTMFTTAASAQNKPVFNESDSNTTKISVFQTKSTYSPLGSVRNSEGLPSQLTDNYGTSNTELMERIRQEAKRLIKRKQINLNTSNSSDSTGALSVEEASNNESSSSGKFALTTSPKKSSNQLMLSHNDLPIFSMNQVNSICERMIGERETALREEYDKILAKKMSEQYDAFVKFTHEQIQRRFESSQCSYVS